MRSALRRRMILALVAAPLAAGCHRPDARVHVSKADAYLAQSRLPEAIIEYRLALQAEPQRGDLRTRLAEVYLRAHDADDALREYVRAADLLPTDPAAQLRAGRILLAAGAFVDAKARATRLLTLDPTSADGQVLLGNALAGLKDMDGALAEYTDALALDPAMNEAYANIGAVQFARGDRVKAEAAFRKAVEVAPTSVTARLALANFLWATGRLSETERTLTDALALDPGSVATNGALGTFYMASHRMKDAGPYFQVLAAAATTPAAVIGLSDYYVTVGRFEDARALLKKLAATEESFAVATTRLAAVDAAAGDRAAALSALGAVLAKYPKDTSARLFRARVLLVDGQRDAALAQANAVLSDERNTPEAAAASFLIGRIQAASDRPAEAIKAYEQVLAQQAQPLAAYLALAALHLASGSVDLATTYTQQALAIQPGNADARALMVRILQAEHRSTEARLDIATLQRDFPNSPTVLNLAATQHRLDGQVEAARAGYLKALELAPNDLEATAGLVDIDLAAGRTKDAVTRIERGLAAGTPTVNFVLLAARTYTAVGNAVKTEELLKRAIEREPARLEAYDLLARAYIRQHRLDDARVRFQQMVDQDPRSTSANTMLGMLLELEQRQPEAEQQYQKVLGFDPRAAVAANNLAWLYVSSNRNLDDALRFALVAQEQLPDEPHVNDTLGWIYYRKSMGAAAIRHLESSVRKDASDPTTHYHLGMAYAQAHDLVRARKELQTALALRADFEGAADARKTLSGLGG
jgi:tetratricopeptide (TPR) repeat protein